jgi:Cu-processing system permease protein
MNPIITIARKEFKDGLRNRWMLAMTLVFALFSLGLSFLGSAASGTIGFASLASTLVSLASLAVILLPLIALLVSYQAFVGEYEQGTLILLLTYPITRIQILLGKFIGQGCILAVAAIAGFGTAAMAIFFSSDQSGLEIFKAFSGFILSAIFLGWIFIALAYVISLSVTEKSTAAGLALLVWFLFVLVFDLVLLAVLVATEGKLNAELMSGLLLLNPTDVFRLINYQLADPEGLANYGGALQVLQEAPPSKVTLFLILFAWLLAPLGVAGWIFQKRSI